MYPAHTKGIPGVSSLGDSGGCVIGLYRTPTTLGHNSKVDEAENQIYDMEHKEAKNNQSEQKEEKRIQKNKDRVRSLWDNFKCTNIQIIGVPEGEEE